VFTINAETIAQGIKKLFGIKRFASVEFTARHAFENLDVAMILIQFLALIGLVVLLSWCVIWLQGAVHRKKVRTLKRLLGRLASEISLAAENGDTTLKEMQQSTIKELEEFFADGKGEKIFDQAACTVFINSIKSLSRMRADHTGQLSLIDRLVALAEAE